jgi:hydroxymethylpyrimidine/phosphomethylpyrimidine kinase
MSPVTLPTALTIAGSDSGGGAGIQADLKTFQELDVFGTSVLVALTAQNTLGVHAIHEVPAHFVTAQLDAVATDFRIEAAKTGMLANAAIIDAVAEGVQRHGITRLIVDPVCASTHGDPLLRPDAVHALRERLLPLAEVATPNLGEVAILCGVEVSSVDDLPRAAAAMKDLGPRWVLIKGGHLPDSDDAVDVLSDGTQVLQISGTRLDVQDTHGTGCTLAAAITAHRARGLEVIEAVWAAKEFVTGAIHHALHLGKGIGPVDHGWRRR